MYLCKLYNLSMNIQADLVKSDVLNAFSVFVDLEHTEEIFVYEDGYRKKLLKLKGTVPVHFAGSEYNVPISIWLSKRHPFRRPIVYVTPTSRMHVMSGNFVDLNGKVNIPYLTDWNYAQKVKDVCTVLERNMEETVQEFHLMI
ncbi:tumor susceptibility gene 101 protein-like [Mercenaria mercenaria]|uniref:tumor susceptibility gene 101 protein-like n=1 Tax=Mercenaria mercenaria TaxID=6596 RepID=UPI00234EA782|nr:tumor susceptibility gene 101 protein-like [Mercenaria mercenaria]